MSLSGCVGVLFRLAEGRGDTFLPAVGSARVAAGGISLEAAWGAVAGSSRCGAEWLGLGIWSLFARFQFRLPRVPAVFPGPHAPGRCSSVRAPFVRDHLRMAPAGHPAQRSSARMQKRGSPPAFSGWCSSSLRARGVWTICVFASRTMS